MMKKDSEIMVRNKYRNLSGKEKKRENMEGMDIIIFIKKIRKD